MYPNFKSVQKTEKLKHMFADEKSTFHLPIKNQAKINKEQYQKFVVDTIIKQVCSFKTLHGLQPFARYDAKHHRSTSIAYVFEVTKEKLMVDGKQKKIIKIIPKKGWITQR